nr:gamma-glutamylcyclotransferase [Motilibacter aurantiacus]
MCLAVYPYDQRVALYAAYGSNMDARRMMQRAPHSPARGSGWLVGWRLTFGGEDLGWEGALATVVETPEDPASSVFVMLYDLTDLDARQLDEWEGAAIGLYRKLRVRVQTLDGDALAWLYVLNAYEGGLPSARYLGLIAEAAEVAGAPSDYVSELRARPCVSVGPGPAS